MLLAAVKFAGLLASGVLGLTDAQLALVISAAAIIYVIVRWRRNAVIKRNAGSPSAPSGNTSNGHSKSIAAPHPLSVREVAVELQALLAELEETSRRLTAQLDNRCQRIELLLAQADEKISRLEGLAQGAEAPAPPPAIPISSLGINPALNQAQRTLVRLRQERGAPPAAQDPAYQPIYSLADRGRSPHQIAQELGRQPGEIELILALRRRS